MEQEEEEHEPTKHIRFGFYGKREDDDGELKISIVKVTVEVRTNDTQEHVLNIVKQAQEKMMDSVVKNFSALYVPLCELPH